MTATVELDRCTAVRGRTSVRRRLAIVVPLFGLVTRGRAHCADARQHSDQPATRLRSVDSVGRQRRRADLLRRAAAARAGGRAGRLDARRRWRRAAGAAAQPAGDAVHARRLRQRRARRDAGDRVRPRHPLWRAPRCRPRASPARSIGTAIVYFLATRIGGGLSTNVLLLAGVTLNTFFSALITFVQYLIDFADWYRTARWLLGNLDVSSFSPILAATPLIGGVVRAVRAAAADVEPADARRGRGGGARRRRRPRAAHRVFQRVVGDRRRYFAGRSDRLHRHRRARTWCGCSSGSDHRIVLPAATLFGAAFLVDLRSDRADGDVADRAAGRHRHGDDRRAVLSVAAGEEGDESAHGPTATVTVVVARSLGVLALLVLAIAAPWRRVAAGEADHFARAGADRDGVRHGRRRSGRRGQQLRRRSAAGADAAARRRAARSGCRAHHRASTRSGAAVRQPDRSDDAAHARVDPVLRVPSRGLAGVTATIRALGQRTRTRRAGRRRRPPASSAGCRRSGSGRPT